MSVARNIVQLRKYHNLTQNELSEYTGINRSVLNRIEKGTRPVRDDELEIFADYFNVTADYLLGRDSKVGVLSKKQADLLGMFDGLNEEGQNALMVMLNSLKVSHARQKSKTASVVQKNLGGINNLAVNGNIYNK